MNQEHQIAELMEYWQKSLRLQDWKITLEFVCSNQLPDGALGRCEMTMNLKAARIRLCKFDAWGVDDRNLPYHHEQTLVHELLHLHFAPFAEEEGSVRDLAQEVAINLIADALVAERHKTMEYRYRQEGKDFAY